MMQAAASNGNLPGLLIAVTGKGPQKAMYEQKMRELRLKHVAFRTLWLEAADYPLLLGSADLGISLHTSSSGLDLPMKVSSLSACDMALRTKQQSTLYCEALQIWAFLCILLSQALICL